MALLDFASRQKVVAVGGRYYKCRPPTVHTVAVFLRLFGLQAAALCEAAARGLPLSERDVIEQLVSKDSVASAAAVLDTCVSSGDPLFAIESVERLRDLAEAVASLTDPQRIVKATGLDTALQSSLQVAQQVDEETHHDADAVCYVAAHFSVSPSDVLEWPYLAFLAAGEYLKRLADRRKEDDQSRATVIPGVPLDGIIFEKEG